MRPVKRRGPAPSALHLLFTALGSVLVLFVLAPLAGMFLATSAGDLGRAAADRAVTGALLLSLSAGLAATLATALFGIPLAWLLARKEFPGKSLLSALVDLPMVVPHTAAGIALLTVFGREARAGRLLERLGVGFTGTFLGITAAMAFVSLPFLVNAAREGFCAVPERLEKAARSLGASPWRVFRTITLPLAKRSILAGMIMMWGRGISEFGAVVIIAYHPMTATVLIAERFNDYGLAYARSAAVLLLMAAMALFLLLRVLSGRRLPEGGGRAGG